MGDKAAATDCAACAISDNFGKVTHRGQCLVARICWWLGRVVLRAPKIWSSAARSGVIADWSNKIAKISARFSIFDFRANGNRKSRPRDTSGTTEQEGASTHEHEKWWFRVRGRVFDTPG